MSVKVDGMVCVPVTTCPYYLYRPKTEVLSRYQNHPMTGVGFMTRRLQTQFAAILIHRSVLGFAKVLQADSVRSYTDTSPITSLFCWKPTAKVLSTMY